LAVLKGPKVKPAYVVDAAAMEVEAGPDLALVGLANPNKDPDPMKPNSLFELSISPSAGISIHKASVVEGPLAGAWGV